MPPASRLKFPIEAINSGEAISIRDRVRATKCMEIHGELKCLGRTNGQSRAFSEIQGNDRPENLVDQPSQLIRTLEVMEQRGLTQASLSEHPWSDDYWPLYKGLVAARYADPDFPAFGIGSSFSNWSSNLGYIEKHPASAIISSGNDKAIDLLSPAEKYELLIGDSTHALSENMWQQGDALSDSNGDVETWIGICDGWAQAAMTLPRPGKTVTLLASDKTTQVRFYPSDAKALATWLWSRGNAPIRFIGGRCDVKNPPEDENGRIINQDCFDTNPGTWHLSVVNQLGLARRGFLLDAAYDYEVWNQPALAYQYRYFNPKTMQVVKTIDEAKVPAATFTSDKFRKYRSPKAVTLVGISMDFTYIEETDPSHRSSDTPKDDATTTVKYLYDLELDSAGNIIGGEWYTREHPDFLWVPLPGAHAASGAEDHAVGSWDVTHELPPSWLEAANLAEKSLQPLGKLVETILQTANN